MTGEEIQSIFSESEIAADSDYLRSLAEIKRFLERWNADSEFRKQLPLDPTGVAARYHLKVDPQEIQWLLATEAIQRSGHGPEVQTPLSIKRFRAFLAELLTLDHRISTTEPRCDPRFKAWRERQIARCWSQLDKRESGTIIHAPVCFELSRGCSVGCWFCGVSAPRLSDIFLYNPENARLWQGALELIGDIIGPAAGYGFCYWATDPLDNPDYEKFCNDFHEILGYFPQTTTALPLKDVARTRALLRLSNEKGCWLNRFSILSLKQLDQVHREFTPQELAFVILVLLNKGSRELKKNAGRARERNTKREAVSGTIACVSGFLFNMVDRSVKLISPCPADDRWPLGYRIHDEGTFSDTSDLKILLEKMIAQNMPLTVRSHDLIRFRYDLSYESLLDGFRLSTPFQTRQFRQVPYVRELGELIREGTRTAKEITLLLGLCGASQTSTLKGLNLMFKMGVLDDEPGP